jgi:hypothetical protein
MIQSINTIVRNALGEVTVGEIEYSSCGTVPAVLVSIAGREYSVPVFEGTVQNDGYAADTLDGIADAVRRVTRDELDDYSRGEVSDEVLELLQQAWDASPGEVVAANTCEARECGEARGLQPTQL